jgi:DNA-binding transcriptional ArsR family regulator
MHPTQLEILDSLRQATNPKKFSDLLKDVAETSDNLTYHLKQLQKAGFIEPVGKGRYLLAQKGTVYLNNNLELNQDLFPTVSCMLELRDKSNNLLMMKKLKQPFIGTFHLLTFGIISSKSLPDQIQDFLNRYEITASGIEFQRLYRKRVRRGEGNFIFDKFFLNYSGHFTAFKNEVGDREFSVIGPNELSNPNFASDIDAAPLHLPKEDIFSEEISE